MVKNMSIHHYCITFKSKIGYSTWEFFYIKMPFPQQKKKKKIYYKIKIKIKIRNHDNDFKKDYSKKKTR